MREHDEDESSETDIKINVLSTIPSPLFDIYSLKIKIIHKRQTRETHYILTQHPLRA
jgi:hypothetical protein